MISTARAGLGSMWKSIAPANAENAKPMVLETMAAAKIRAAISQSFADRSSDMAEAASRGVLPTINTVTILATRANDTRRPVEGGMDLDNMEIPDRNTRAMAGTQLSRRKVAHGR